MKRAVVIAVAVLAVLIGWWFGLRSDDAPVPVQVELAGFRALYPPNDTPGFDAESLPRVRFEGGEFVDLVWRLPGGVIVADVERVDVPGATVVKVARMPADPPPGEGHLCLGTTVGRVCLPARWSVAPSALPALAEAVQHRVAGRLDSAAAALARADRSDPAVDLWIGVEHARLTQSRGTADDAIDAWVAAADDAERLGVKTEAGRRLRAAAHHAWRARRSARLQALVDRAATFDDPVRHPLGTALLHYSRAVLATMLDDWRTARWHYEAAIDGFARFAEPHRSITMVEGLALLLAALGDDDAALTRLRTLEPLMSDADPETRARYLLNRSWLRFRRLGADATDAERDAVDAELAEARQAARTSKDRMLTAAAATDQAWAALDRGHVDRADQLLDEATALDPDGQGFAAPYTVFLRARLALARGRHDDADAFFTRVAERAAVEIGPISELGWRAAFGRGRVARARGDDDAALTHFRAALATLERLGQRASLRGDRANFHADRRALADETVALLLDHGDRSAAFAVTDAARARPLRALQAGLRIGSLDPAARARWSAALDDARRAADAARDAAATADLAPVSEEAARLADADAARRARDAALDAAFAFLDDEAPLTVPPGVDGDTLRARLATDEVVFAFAPAATGWVAFRVDAGGVDVRRFGEGDPLGPWRDLPPTVKHVYIAPGGHPAAFALATDGDDPLLARVSVAFLPYAGLLIAEPPPATGRPLVVADPRGDLIHAADEGRAVAGHLDDARLLAGAAATPEAVLTGLRDASLFHVAGHGVLDDARPWNAHLRLADPHRLELADVLTHPVAARVVVLSGCETGVDAVLLDDRVVGLADAFLAAGAGAVIVSDREVPDQPTRRFMERFYAAGGAQHPARALREAALAARRDGEASWSAFRLVGRR